MRGHRFLPRVPRRSSAKAGLRYFSQSERASIEALSLSKKANFHAIVGKNNRITALTHLSH